MEISGRNLLERCQRRAEGAMQDLSLKCGELTVQAKTEQAHLNRQKISFSDIKQRLLKESGHAVRPKLAYRNVAELHKRLKAEKSKLELAKAAVSKTQAQRSQAAKQFKTEKLKLEKLSCLMKGHAQKAAARKEVHEGESCLETAIARASQLGGTGGQGPINNDWRPEGSDSPMRVDCTSIEDRKLITQDDPGTISDPLLKAAIEPSAPQIPSIGMHAGGSGAGQSLPERNPNTPNLPQHFASNAAANARAKFDSLKSQIKGISSWDNISGSGVVLDYVSRSGRNLEVRLQSSSDNLVKVQIVPEYYCDRRALWEEKNAIGRVLKDAGLKIGEVLVLGAQASLKERSRI